MIKVLFREAVFTAVALFVVSVVAFATLDRALRPDWYGLAGFAGTVPLDRARLLGRELPLLWNPDSLDAAQRTERVLEILGDPRRATAGEAELVARGSAALPALLARLPSLDASRQWRVFRVLAALGPTLGTGNPPPIPVGPADLAEARQYWERFDAAHGLDLRPSFAGRLAIRVAEHESRNAAERLEQLGTYGLPAVFRALDATRSTPAQVRLVRVLSRVTKIPLRLEPGAGSDEVRHTVEAWRAWWFVQRGEFTTLAPWERTTARFRDTRYGRWLARALGGRLGLNRVTHRANSLELRERLPVSALTSGLGGLLGTGLAIAFGGPAALRARARREKFIDLLGAVIPGLVALILGWLLISKFVSSEGAPGSAVLRLSETVGVVRLLAASALSAVIPAAWLLRARASPLLDAARLEAEAWTLRGQSPSPRRALRHAARIAAASLLCPLALAAPTVLLASLLVELGLGVRGMGALTLRALVAGDGAWLLVGILTIVPVLLGRRWALLALVWVLGTRPDGRVRRFRGASLPAPPRPTPVPTAESR